MKIRFNSNKIAGYGKFAAKRPPCEVYSICIPKMSLRDIAGFNFLCSIFYVLFSIGRGFSLGCRVWLGSPGLAWVAGVGLGCRGLLGLPGLAWVAGVGLGCRGLAC